MKKNLAGIETSLYEQLVEMGNTDKAVLQWQQKRIARSIILLIVGGFLAFFFKEYALFIFVLTISLSGYAYYGGSRFVGRMYQGYRFKRQLEFSKFCRLVIPYLSISGQNVNMYTIFSKVIDRMKHEEDKKQLRILMKQMVDSPTDLKPFVTFAKNMSNTDSSVIFMSTLFDIKEGSADTDVIKRLGEMASKEILSKIEDIKNYKLKRFTFFPTKMAMSTILVVFGFAIAYLIQAISEIKIGF